MNYDQNTYPDYTYRRHAEWIEQNISMIVRMTFAPDAPWDFWPSRESNTLHAALWAMANGELAYAEDEEEALAYEAAERAARERDAM